MANPTTPVQTGQDGTTKPAAASYADLVGSSVAKATNGIASQLAAGAKARATVSKPS
jgi:hypothetical protein